MTTQLAAVILVLIAAATEALSNVLQHKAANSGGRSGKGSQRAGEAAAVLRTLKKPMFLLGFLLMVIGYGFHVASLGLGNLSIIQVIFVTQLVFILPFSHWVSRVHVARTDWIGAAVATLGIATFVTFAKPSKGADNATTTQWVISIAIISLLCLIVVVAGYRTSGTARALLIGCSGGLINGLVAPLTKGTLYKLSGGLGAMFSSWLLYVTIVAVLLGVLFPLMAFRAGPITASFPAVISLNPIVATILGIYLFGETLESGLVNVIAIAVAAVAMFVGIMWLSRSQAIARAFEEPAA